MSEELLLDDIRIVHELRGVLCETWGERAVPVMWSTQDRCGLRVRGTNAEYIVRVEVVSDDE